MARQIVRKTFSLDADVANALEVYAARQHRNLSSMVNYVLHLVLLSGSPPDDIPDPQDGQEQKARQ